MRVERMILSNAVLVSDPDASRFAWAALARYQNVHFVRDRIIDIHELPRKQRSNAEKQAAQIRYCLIQAREYFEASKSVTLATKPNLLYYSIMSLAIPEVLYKQSGDSSLDRAREQHQHHGLTLKVRAAQKEQSLKEVAGTLRAEPYNVNGVGIGTFELWHRSAREMPLCGKRTSSFDNQNGAMTHYFALLMPNDQRLPLLPKHGLSLFDCIESLPYMTDFLSSFGLSAEMVRGRIEVSSRFSSPDQPPISSTMSIIVHPGDPDLIERFLGNIIIREDQLEKIKIQRVHNAAIIKFEIDQLETPGAIDVPNGTMWTKEEFRLWPDKRPLNEFGYLYVALYIIGNYARYYPDKWLLDVETHSPLSLAIEALVRCVEHRVALLSYSEFSRAYNVVDR